jgi:formylglycine-generating enzyme required for sulfatase activity
MTELNWYEFQAFCIWDGGFLPSDAEWQYASAGGAEQRPMPWGIDPLDPSRAVFFPASNRLPAFVGSVPMGNGKFGQSDLAGNAWEWTLDSYFGVSYPGADGGAAGSVCIDCADVSASTERVVRGGGFDTNANELVDMYRSYGITEGRYFGIGARCARSP